jgi:mono/diheme cytochrome c family protein
MPAWIAALLLCVLAGACGPKKRVEPPAPKAAPVFSSGAGPAESGTQSDELALDGKVLYEDLCASCHGALEQSSAARASANAIRSAMLEIPEMQALPELNDEKVESLRNALGKIPPGKAKGKP